MPRAAVDVVVFTATPNEAVAARRVQREPFGHLRLGTARATIGRLGALTCLTVASGIGWKRLDRTFHEFTRLFETRLFVNFGAAGAVDPGLGIGALTVPAEIILYALPEAEQEGETFRLPVHDLRRIHRSVHVTRAGTNPRDVRDAEVRRLLALRLAIDTTDCETYRLADFCRQRAVPFLACRAVTDRADAHAGFDYMRSAEAVLNERARLLEPLVLRMLEILKEKPPGP